MNGGKMHLNAALIAGLLALSGAAQADNVRLHGALVAEPCVIAPGTKACGWTLAR